MQLEIMSNNNLEIEFGSTVIPQTSLTTVQNATNVWMEFGPGHLVLRH